MKTEWISEQIDNNFICFPVDDIDINNCNVRLTSFYEFLEDTTDLHHYEIETVCNCIRYWIAKHRSFYVDKNSNILFRLNLKDMKGAL